MAGRIMRWTKTLLAAALTAGAAFALLVDGALDSLDAAQTDYSRLKEDYVSAQRRLLQFEERRARLVEIRRMQQQLARMLPDAAGVEVRAAELEASVRAAGAAARLAPVEVSLGESRPREFYADRRFNVTASGEYRALVELVRGLTSGSGEVRVVRRLVLAPGPDGRLQLTLDADAIAYLTDETVRGLRDATGAAKAKGSR
jgi:Tfp pilus assembly protein PilO